MTLFTRCLEILSNALDTLVAEEKKLSSELERMIAVGRGGSQYDVVLADLQTNVERQRTIRQSRCELYELHHPNRAKTAKP